MSGLAAKVVVVAVNNSASANKIVRFFFIARFERFFRQASIQTEGDAMISAVLIDNWPPVFQQSGKGTKYETDSIFHLHRNSRIRANCWLTGAGPTARFGGQEGVLRLRVFGAEQKRYVLHGKGQYLPLW